MSIADITNPPTRLSGPPCSVCATLATLPPDEATALRGLLANPAWRWIDIEEALHDKAGIDLAWGNLSRHARGKCTAKERLRP